MKTVVLMLGGRCGANPREYAMHGDKTKPGETFRLVVQAWVTGPPGPGGARGMTLVTMVDEEVTKRGE